MPLAGESFHDRHSRDLPGTLRHRVAAISHGVAAIVCRNAARLRVRGLAASFRLRRAAGRRDRRYLTFLGRRGNDVIRQGHTALPRPGDLLLVRETATSLPALFCIAAAALAMHTRKGGREILSLARRPDRKPHARQAERQHRRDRNGAKQQRAMVTNEAAHRREYGGMRTTTIVARGPGAAKNPRISGWFRPSRPRPTIPLDRRNLCCGYSLL
jgi:hypothetical protein